MVNYEAIDTLPRLFRAADADGVSMAVRAAGPAEASDVRAASLVALTEDVLAALRSKP